MGKKAFALIEATVSLFVVALVGMALLDLVLTARRLSNGRQQGQYVQGLLNSALEQTLSATDPQSSGEAQEGGHRYTWRGARTSQDGYRLAHVDLRRDDQPLTAAERVQLK